MYDLLQQRARSIRVEQLAIGLGYTGVLLEDGSMGVAFTWIDEKQSCTLMKDPVNYEGKTALPLLEKLFSEDILDRSVAIAAVNALNYPQAASFENDRDSLLDDLGIGGGSKVSMIGYFGPVVKKIEDRSARLNVYDMGKKIGSEEEFFANLEHDTDAVILTSTSVIHGSTERILAHVPWGVPCVLLGPTTPMMPEAFSHLPITILGGTLPQRNQEVLRAIRHGKGTHDIQRASKKVYWNKDSRATARAPEQLNAIPE